FRRCISLTSVTIPASVTSIRYSISFVSCSSLTSVNVDENNQYYSSIDGIVFDKDKTKVLYYPGGKKDTSYTIPDTVTHIEQLAFYGCTSLTSVIIPDSVIEIGSDAFSNCTKLKSIKIPDGVTRIGSYAFKGCKSLASVTIPNSVTSIGGYAFNNCTSLTSVYITDIAAWCKMGFGERTANPLYYAKNLYLNGELVKDLVIPDGVTSIGGSSFAGTSLTSVTIPGSVTEIGGSAFYGCESLESVKMMDGVTSISTYMFRDCTSLTSVDIPNSVTSVGTSAFYNCTLLTRVTIPDSVTEIGGSAFYGCTSLTRIKISASITTIHYETFYNCTSLTRVTIPDGVTGIDNHAFDDCTALISIIIPESIEDLSTNSFDGCDSLTDVYYGGSASQWEEMNRYGTPVFATATKHYLNGPADYTSVETAIAKVNALNRTRFTKKSLERVDNAVNAVVYDLAEDQQTVVDGYAATIEDALSKLELKSTAGGSAIELTDALVNYRLRCTTAVVDGNLVLTADPAGTSSMKVRLGNLPEGATVAIVGTNANASMANGIISVTNPGMKNVSVPMVITSANGVKTEFVLVADFDNAIRYATYARLSQTGDNITVTSGAATAYVLFDTTDIEGGYIGVTDVSRNLLGRYVVSGSSVRFYNPAYGNGSATVRVKNAAGEIVKSYKVTVTFTLATDYQVVLPTSLRCTYKVNGDNITITANAGVSNVYLNFGRYYSESLSASVNNDIIKKMGARSWRIMACDEPVEFDLYFDATAYGAKKVTRHITVSF
ncbi:MAG: leucine-rich repeat domain-containing protein, partial [Clostridia bacterium]|nr:leucine-rich repeat domain-containing protein [Clostridia bacterium]